MDTDRGALERPAVAVEARDKDRASPPSSDTASTAPPRPPAKPEAIQPRANAGGSILSPPRSQSPDPTADVGPSIETTRDHQRPYHPRSVPAGQEAATPRLTDFDFSTRPLSHAQTLAIPVSPLTAVTSGPYPTFEPYYTEERRSEGYSRPVAHRARSASGRLPARLEVARRRSSGYDIGGGIDVALPATPADNLRRSVIPPYDHRSPPDGVDLSQIPYRRSAANGNANGDALSIMSRGERTIAIRLSPTLEHTIEELHKARRQARITSWSLNIAIGLQIVLGAFTTGIAAAGNGRHTAVAIAVLGGLSTLSASYLARARGSGEPEASSLRCHDLENFHRELEGVITDRGWQIGGDDNDKLVKGFRARFEEIMGNPAPGVDLGGIMRGIHDRWGTRTDAGPSGTPPAMPAAQSGSERPLSTAHNEASGEGRMRAHSEV